VRDLRDSVKQTVIYGRNPVREALRGGRTLHKVLVARGADPRLFRELRELARPAGIPVQVVERPLLDQLTGGGAAHQGVAATVSVKDFVAVEALLTGENPLLVVLNAVQDPRNLGAILRTAEAAGVDGAVVPSRRAAPLTPAAAKTAAGAVEYLPVARVTNIALTLREFKQKGLWVVGADPEAPVSYWDADLGGPLALVIGGESAGLGRAVHAECDSLVRIPMSGRVGSLNASVAAALLIYEAVRQRRAGGSR
jgi:23S rRNA (guanosine2251-2'-O)-methyltransferase